MTHASRHVELRGAQLPDLELAPRLREVINPRTPTLSLQALVGLLPGWRFVCILNPMGHGGFIAPFR